MERLGVKDKRVIALFCEGKPCSGYKLDTDGKVLDGMWMGGKSIARRVNNGVGYGSFVVFGPNVSRSIQLVQRAIKRELHPHDQRRIEQE